MILLLFLMLGGGAVAAAASSGETSSGSSGDGLTYLVSSSLLPVRSFSAPPELAARMKAAGYVWREDAEKFCDPLFACWHVPGGGAYTIGGGRNPGAALMYLENAPPRAVDRVALLRARAEAPPFHSAMVHAMAENSLASLDKAATDLQAKLGDRAQWPGIAQGLGIPVAQMAQVEQGYEQAINKAFRMGGLDVMSLFKDLRTLASDAVVNAVSAQLSAVGKAIGSASDVKDMASFIGDVSSVASTILPILKIIVDKAIALDVEARQRWAAECASYVDKYVMGPVKTATEGDYVPAWHVLDVWQIDDDKTGEKWCPEPKFLGGAKWVPSNQINGAAADARAFLEQGQSLGRSAARVAMRRSWYTAALLMSDPTVGPTWANLGLQRGGPWSSDEIVALVGVPIAIANNLEPWRFCELLWGYARGWAGWPNDATYVKRATCKGAPVVTNAWALTWADVAKCAFALAEALKASQAPIFMVSK